MICGECLGALENGGVAVVDIESGGGGLRHSATGKIVGGGGARRDSHSGNGGGFDHVQHAIEDKARCFVVGIGEAVERDAQAHAAAAQRCIFGHDKGALHRGGKVERTNDFEDAVVIPVKIEEGCGAGCGQAIEFGLEYDGVAASNCGTAAGEERVSLRSPVLCIEFQRLAGFVVDDPETEQARGVGGHTGQVIDLQTACECRTKHAKSEVAVAIDGERSCGIDQTIGAVRSFLDGVSRAVVERAAVGSVHHVVACGSLSFEVPRIGIHFGAFVPNESAVGLLSEGFAVGIDHGVRRLAAQAEGAQLIAVVGGFEPPVGADVVVAGRPGDDVRRGAVFVQSARTECGFVEVVAVGGGEIPRSRRFGLRVTRHVIGCGRGGGANARSAAGREIARSDVALGSSVAHVVRVGLSGHGGEGPELFQRIVAFADHEGAFVVFGDEEGAVVVPSDAIDFVGRGVGGLRKESACSGGETQKTEEQGE